ncbi:MAG: cytochrome c [Gammaproteobacteria bacterium]|nr:cytochrome c [Gammaproteobacteria bacterium]
MTRLSAMAAGLALVASLAYAPPGAAQDFQRGGLLYENHCNQCHEDHVHQRGESRLRSQAEVRKYVQIWQGELNLRWSDGDIADVLFYLNERYYGFPPAVD